MPHLTANSQLILDAAKADQKLIRMAWQIYENNYAEKEIVLAGIVDGGYKLAGILKGHLEKISEIKVHLAEIIINKEEPGAVPATISNGTINISGKNIVLVDDVGNSGRTLFYAQQPLFLLKPKSVQVALLVERMHKVFPIKADYVGFPIATTFKNHVIVTFDKEGLVSGAYLY
jgi:pyrimidine operon attenuation protein / uracil phosphoribosyltransferase